MSENKADPLREALKPLAAISLWRDKYQDGPDMLSNDKLARYFTADQVRAARAALAAPQPAAPLGGREAMWSCTYPECLDQQTGNCTVTRYCPGPAPQERGVAEYATVMEAHKAFDRILRKEVIDECANASEKIAKAFRTGWGADTSLSSAVNLATSAIRALGKETGR